MVLRCEYWKSFIPGHPSMALVGIRSWALARISAARLLYATEVPLWFLGVTLNTPIFISARPLREGEVDGVGSPWFSSASSTPTLQLVCLRSAFWGAVDQVITAPSMTLQSCSCIRITTKTTSVILVGCESRRVFHEKRWCQNAEVSVVQCFFGNRKTHRMEAGAWGLSMKRWDELCAWLEMMVLGEAAEPGNIGEQLRTAASNPPGPVATLLHD